MLPWFIWRKILHYVIDYQHRYLCLVNRKWFNFKGGGFIAIETDNLSNDIQLSKWSKLAKFVTFKKYNNLNWDFLVECRGIKCISCYDLSTVDNNLIQLKEFMSKSNFDSLYLYFDNEEDITVSFQLLEIVSNKINKLDIEYNDYLDSPYDKLLKLDYSNLQKLSIFLSNGIIHFNTINEFMPHLRHLEIRVNTTSMLPIEKKFGIFKYLKALTIETYTTIEEDYSINIMDLLNYQFPNLIQFKSHNILYNDTLNLISQSMPQLQQLDFYIQFNESVDIKLPENFLNNLEEFKYNSENDEGINVSFQLDLTKTPKLRVLTYGSKFHLINTNEHHQPLLNRIYFESYATLPQKAILDQLSHLKRVKVDCVFYSSTKLGQIIKSLKFISKLSLENIQTEIPISSLLSSTFNFKHLKLHGTHYLTEELLLWIVNKSNLKKLTIKYLSKLSPTQMIEPTMFTNLQRLKVKCSESAMDYFREIFLLVPPQELIIKSI